MMNQMDGGVLHTHLVCHVLEMARTSEVVALKSQASHEKGELGYGGPQWEDMPLYCASILHLTKLNLNRVA